MSEYLEYGTILEYLGIYPRTNHLDMVSAERSETRVSHQCPFFQVCQLAKAVVYLHEEGIVHGGIKCANILVSGRRRVLLGGFSCAVDVGMREVQYDYLRPIASFRWSSPEFIAGGLRTFSSDVYSFGVTVNEVSLSRLSRIAYSQMTSRF